MEGWPEQVERSDVVRFFSPVGAGLAFVRTQPGAPNQFGIALQLGALQWLGFIPEDLTAAPAEALAALGSVLDVPSRGDLRLRGPCTDAGRAPVARPCPRRLPRVQ